jgi:hypothetical protein
MHEQLVNRKELHSDRMKMNEHRNLDATYIDSLMQIHRNIYQCVFRNVIYNGDDDRK